jgi:hypothetical protein
VPAAAVLILAVIAPFETTLITVGPLTLTTVEAVALTAIAASLAAIVYAGRPLVWDTPIARVGAVCLAVFAVAALFSPVDRGNALRFVARMLTAGAVYLLVANAVTTREMAKRIVGVLVATGVVISVIAVLEAAQIRPVHRALTPFRTGFHVVGGQLRATSTMLYPTIASMYLEVIFALALWLVLEPRQSRRRTAAVFAALAIIGGGIIATFTRAGLIAMVTAIGVVGALRYVKARQLDAGHAWLAALLLVLATLILLSRSPDVLLTRLRTEGSQDWYGATYSVPPTLRLRTGADYSVPITLSNTGRVAWDSMNEPAFAMSYHWLRAGTDAVVQFDGWRTPFPVAVEPNTRVTLPVNVRAPGEPGKYVLVWDVVHEHRAWLSTEGIESARTVVDVEGERVSATSDVMGRLPAANFRADRWTLWQAALRIAADHPLLGIGPDNFRQVYGRYAARAGERTWDTRVHANNMYLEVLAGTGAFGLTALLGVLIVSGIAVFRRWRTATAASGAAAAAFCAVWLVIAGHGLVDSFLSFTTTYVMFALVAGLAFAGEGHADRV